MSSTCELYIVPDICSLLLWDADLSLCYCGAHWAVTGGVHTLLTHSRSAGVCSSLFLLPFLKGNFPLSMKQIQMLELTLQHVAGRLKPEQRSLSEVHVNASVLCEWLWGSLIRHANSWHRLRQLTKLAVTNIVQLGTETSWGSSRGSMWTNICHSLQMFS